MRRIFFFLFFFGKIRRKKEIVFNLINSGSFHFFLVTPFVSLWKHFSLYIHSMYFEMKIIPCPPPRIHGIRISLSVSIYVGQTRDYLNGFQPFGRYNFFDILASYWKGTQAAKRPPTEGWQTSTSSPQNSFIRERRGTSDLEETAPFRMHNTF